MSINLDKLSSAVEYNILLIGQTNMGKSTFVNAFVNYIKFGSLGDAMAGTCEELIPTIFELKDSNSGEKVKIETECDEKEKFDNFSNARSPRVYTLRCNEKVIKLIDTPGWKYKVDNEYLHTVSQCLEHFQKLHAIVWITSGDCFDFIELTSFQSIHKSAFKNMILCYTNDLIYKTSDEKTLENVKCNIQAHIKITPNHGQNLLTIDNCAYECLVAHRRGVHSSDEEQTNECRTGWICKSKQIQSMLDYMASEKACDGTNVVELMKWWQIMNLCLELIKHYYGVRSKSEETIRIVNLLKRNPKEFERIEDICVQLWAMVLYLSLVEWNGFEVLIRNYKFIYKRNEKLVNFYEKLEIISKNRQSFETTFSECSATGDFEQLFTELCNLKHSGLYFRKEIAQITQPNQHEIQHFTISMPQSNDLVKHCQIEEFENYYAKLKSLDQLEEILSIVTKNNLLLVQSAGTAKCDLNNATLHNVVFTCGNSTSEIRDFIVKETHSNMSETDIKFITDNIDSLIKTNFDKLAHVIQNYPPLKLIVKNEQKKRKLAGTKPPKTLITQPDVVSNFRPYMQHLYQQQSDEPDKLKDKLDLIVEQMLILKTQLSIKK